MIEVRAEHRAPEVSLSRRRGRDLASAVQLLLGQLARSCQALLQTRGRGRESWSQVRVLVDELQHPLTHFDFTT
jgi:hypothetical protein